MKIAYLLMCVGLFGCSGVAGGALFGAGGGATSTGEGGSILIPSDAGTAVINRLDAGSDSSFDAGCVPQTCAISSCETMDDGCGNILDCGSCPNQVQGYPSACLSNTCQPFNNTIFSPACVAVCGQMNVGAWNNCLVECQNQSCTVQQSCTNCNFLFSAEPDCLSCLHANFPGQSCGG